MAKQKNTNQNDPDNIEEQDDKQKKSSAPRKDSQKTTKPKPAQKSSTKSKEKHKNIKEDTKTGEIKVKENKSEKIDIPVIDVSDKEQDFTKLDKPTASQKSDSQKPEKKSKKKIIFLIIGLLLILAIGGCYNFFSGTLNNIIDKDGKTPLYKQIQQLATESDQPLKGEAEDRINILLLGMGGNNHNGGTLTDTIMIASIKPSTSQISLISLPRDLAVKVYDSELEEIEDAENNELASTNTNENINSDDSNTNENTDTNTAVKTSGTSKKKGYWEGRKINYAYELGGTDFAVTKVEEVTGLDIHYYVLMDFSGFIQLIDDVGGVEIEANSRFNGYYHIADVGGTCAGADGGPVFLADGDGPYCIFKFYPGTQEMKGQMALMYSRIRKVAYADPENEYYEGSDYARSQRQQLVMEALKNKIFSASTMANPIKITKLLDDLGEHLSTDMELWEMAKLSKYAESLQTDNIINKVIDENQGLVEGYIYPETGAFVIVPTIGEYNFSEIQALCKKIFKAEEEKIAEEEKQIVQEEQVKEEQANIIVLNGTTVEGFAATTKTELESLNLNIVSIGNAPDQKLQITKQTGIYDLTNNNPQTLEKLTTHFDTEKILQDFEAIYPDHEIDLTTADFIIILGANSYE